MTDLASLPAKIEAEGLDRFPSVIGDARRPLPYALVVAQRDEAWNTFFRDERGLVEEQSVRTYADENAACEDFLALLRSEIRIKKLRQEILARDALVKRTMAALRTQVDAGGLGHLNAVIGDASTQKPFALVLARRDEVWSTYFLDERGLVEEQSIRTYDDVEAAAADFLRLLGNLARIEEIGAELAARRQAQRPQ